MLIYGMIRQSSIRMNEETNKYTETINFIWFELSNRFLSIGYLCIQSWGKSYMASCHSGMECHSCLRGLRGRPCLHTGQGGPCSGVAVCVICVAFSSHHCNCTSSSLSFYCSRSHRLLFCRRTLTVHIWVAGSVRCGTLGSDQAAAT